MKATPAIDVMLIRNYTVEPMLPWLEREFSERGLEVRPRVGDFAGAHAEVASADWAAGPDAITSMVVLSLSLEMYSTDFGHASWNCRTACDDIHALAKRCVQRMGVTVVINTVLPPLQPAFGLAVVPGQPSHSAEVESLNLALRRLAAENPGRVVLLDWVSYARELGEQQTYDRRFWHSSGLPYSIHFLRRYASDLAAVAQALAGKAPKCLVLDCDNTLWGGVVGEDGLQGIRLSPDTSPGSHYVEFQRDVLDLHRRGVMLALCSKNNEQDVLEVLDRHPHCLLKREHFAAWRIHWGDKAASLLEIAGELNIGVDALVFVDDSPQECERIGMALPAVRVLRAPESPEGMATFLRKARPFPSLLVTGEDSIRAASYLGNAQRSELAGLAADLEGYKRQLGTRMVARPATGQDLDRIAQLFLKTNQFNLATRRHDRNAVEAFASDPDALLYCARVADKFGDLGLVGVAKASLVDGEVVVDELLLSCRALGRDVEHAFFASFLEAIAQRWKAPRIKADYVPSGRNAQVAGFLAAAGMLAARDPREWAGFESDDLPGLIARNRRTYIEEAG